ncbi:nitroreductase family deazaflavin-dependent oxidoreductase [Actinokineospora inagensis]|uniref:nitroreductase family deazaflavin-dependent oxidoreductase n=1 Tax=Actinokineospora inagensis TaxID=103730 RepID=UPI0003FC1BBE|nr:nitroreductase family deazaflavin-dependent oxidoreductase [Actinokineospora inagensis]
MTTRYLRPSGFLRGANKVIAFLLRRGVTMAGANQLSVRGRKTGEARTVPVNPLDFDGSHYLVSPRGNTQWVRNLRAAGEGELRLGRRVRRFTATEIADDAKPAVLRAYMERWGYQVKQYVNFTATSTDDELRAAAGDHPVFVLS